jgi:Uma2 family endonuclease
LGVKEMWLVDPILQQVHLYDFARDPARAVRLVEDDETFGSALLPGLIVSAAEVFKR